MKDGVPRQVTTNALDAIMELIPRPETVVLTESEYAFTQASGIAASVFSKQAAIDNARYEAKSEMSITTELTSTLLSRRQVADRLGIDTATVKNLRTRGELMTAGTLNHHPAYPAWQLTDDNRVLPQLRSILAAFPADFHALDIQHMMTTPVAELAGKSPRQWLEHGGDDDAVLTIIAALSRV